MDSNVLITQSAVELLHEGRSFVLASIVSQLGSAPRTAGARMIIKEDGSIIGTIGGGLLEAKVMKAAAEVLAEKQSIFMFFNLKADDLRGGIDMICGGTALVLLDPVTPTKENIEVFEAWHKSIHTHSAAFLTVIEGEEEKFTVKGHGILHKDGSFRGTYDLNPMELPQIVQASKTGKHTQIVKLSECNVVVDPINVPKTLYCFGGGHVAKPTTHIADLVGFEVVVIDDREEFCNPARFPEAKQTLVVSDFNAAFKNLPIDGDSFIVIFTRGHLHDLTVLEEALKTNAHYIGMIGSKTKRDRIYEALLAGPFTQKDIDRVYSPIGMEINAQTPEEIGVSIVGELIKVRAQAQ